MGAIKRVYLPLTLISAASLRAVSAAPRTVLRKTLHTTLLSFLSLLFTLTSFHSSHSSLHNHVTPLLTLHSYSPLIPDLYLTPLHFTVVSLLSLLLSPLPTSLFSHSTSLTPLLTSHFSHYSLHFSRLSLLSPLTPLTPALTPLLTSLCHSSPHSFYPSHVKVGVSLSQISDFSPSTHCLGGSDFFTFVFLFFLWCSRNTVE